VTDTADQPLKAAIVPVTPFQQNCAIVWSPETGKGVVIDPGGDVDRILAALKETGVEVEAILLTHGHIDHAGGAAELAERTGAPVIGPHRDDDWLLERLPESGTQYGIRARTVTPDRWLQEGDTVDIGGLPFEVLHCPGHTPGHVVFANRDLKFAIVGDVLFRGSVGRTDFPRGSHDDLIASIRTRLLPLGDDVTFLCGHGPASTIGHERRTNPFLT
jgi:glyoxylase-like metal-dependent hydrolase (beta-lactamase superfamily II)